MRSLLFVLIATACIPTDAEDASLGRGINFGNALEAPSEGEWGFTIKESYFDAVKEAGFDTVRLPVKWSAHAMKDAPYTIDATFFERVDSLVEQALDRDLRLVLNVHHFDELYEEPDGQEERFLAIWRQVAERYSGRPANLVFELLNEPRKPMTPERWNEMFPKALSIVRESNPSRKVIVGPGEWNNINALPKLELLDDKNLIVTVHYYSPFEFTHQGASWADGSEKWLGRTWGSEADRQAVRRDLEKAAAWGQEHNLPVFLGEFGAYSRAPLESRVKWTEFVRSEAERLGMNWAYWEFGSGFGVYDPQTEKWREPLKQALLGSE